MSLKKNGEWATGNEKLRIKATSNQIYKSTSYILANIVHPSFHHSLPQTSHISKISHSEDFTSQTSHILNNPHLEHPTFLTIYIPNIPNPEYPLSWTPHIPNIPYFKHLAYQTSQISKTSHPEHHLISHISSFSRPEHSTSLISYTLPQTYHIENIPHPK